METHRNLQASETHFLDRTEAAPGLPERVLRWISILGFVSLLGACSRQDINETYRPRGDTSSIVATVGSHAITQRMVERIAAQNGHDLREEDGRRMAMHDAVNFELLAIEAEKRGYREHPDLLHYVKSQSVQRMLADTVDSAAISNSVLTDAELEDYYRSHIEKFTPPRMARGRVLGLLKRPGSEHTYEQKLDAVVNAIASGQTPFSELVTQFSDDPAGSSQAGLTPWMAEDSENTRYPAKVVEALFESGDAGTIRGPIEHHSWTYFVQLEEIKGGEAAGFKESKQRIVRQMERARRLRSYAQFVDGIRDSDGVDIETFPERLEQALATESHSGGPPMGPVTLIE